MGLNTKEIQKEGASAIVFFFMYIFIGKSSYATFPGTLCLNSFLDILFRVFIKDVLYK